MKRWKRDIRFGDHNNPVDMIWYHHKFIQTGPLYRQRLALALLRLPVITRDMGEPCPYPRINTKTIDAQPRRDDTDQTNPLIDPG